jgi:L-ribulokinase
MEQSYVIGVDYGTDSVRSIVVNASSGEELAFSVFYYPRWKKQMYCNASQNQFRQHPLDYLEGLEATLQDCLHQVGAAVARNVKGIAIDTTGSTPVAVDASGTPLCLLPAFENNPNAMFVLWKDHTSVREAGEINLHATKFETNYLKYVGGVYSSEWFWAKLLHVLRADSNVAAAIHSWVEHCDWIPFVLTGGKKVKDIKRGVCSAGHKGLWSEAFGGYPPDSFFSSLDPLLTGFTDKLPAQTFTSDKSAGNLSPDWAARLGLSTDVVVAVGAFDAHMGAVGGQIEPYYLSKVIGTSTCDMLVAPANEVNDTLVTGICGQVNGSIIPGMIGMEAGQSAFGDAFAWLKNILTWSLDLLDDEELKNKAAEKIMTTLSEQAVLLPLDEKDEIAIDWLNGRRTPDANQLLHGAFAGLSLATDAPRLFKALVESTCFGAKAIVERFVAEGIPVKGLIGLGGVAKKSPYIMQVLVDVINMPIRIHKSEQTCALGAAMFAATAAGLYTKVEDAMKVMGQGFAITYTPNEAHTAYYQRRYDQYKKLGNFVETHLS